MQNKFKYIFILLSLCLLGCQSTKEHLHFSKKNVLRVSLPTSPNSLDPATAYDADTMELLSHIFEPLLEQGHYGKIKPLLAESWKIEDEGKKYIFKIKQNVKFHNGRLLTASDFKWSIQRNCDPKLGYSFTDAIFNDILGYDEYLQGKCRSISGIKVPDPYTLIFELKGSIPYFLGKMCNLTTAPIAQEALIPGKSISNISQMIGTGPFRPSSYHPDQLFVLRAFQHYHKGTPSIAEIERPIVRHPHTRFLLYQAAKLDILNLDSPQIKNDTQGVVSQKDLYFFSRPSVCSIALNPTQKPFDDPYFRKAIAYALNRKWLADHLLKGIYPIANSVLFPSMPGYRPYLQPFQYDPVKAKKILKQSLYFQKSTKEKPLEIHLEYRSEVPNFQIIAEFFALQINKNLGIKVYLHPIERSIFNQKYINTQLKCFILRYTAGYLDPQDLLSFMLSSYGAWNGTGYKNKFFDQLCMQADHEMDQHKRLCFYQQAEDIIFKDLPLIPLYYDQAAFLIQPHVKGFQFSSIGRPSFAKVTLD